ncbi:MAG: ribonuclease III [Candidatus Binatia bacterium]
MSEAALRELEARLGYCFRERAHLRAALLHASAAEVAGPRTSERLEFLGDAVLGLVLSDLLIERYPACSEGHLSKYRATLVKTASFARKARELGLNEHLTLGRGEERTGGREKASILAAAYEAVMGAIFLESGYGQVKSIVIRHFGDAIDGVGQLETMDAKTELQERLQATHRTTPTYRIVREEGPDHARWFVVEVLLGAEVLASGEGGSKRRAEQAAARHALERTRDPALS